MSRKIFYTTAIVIVIATAIIVRALPGHFYKTGENYYKQSNYIEAYKNFANAKRLAPTNKDYRYYYVLSLAHLKPTIKVQKEMFAIAHDGHQDSASRLAETQVDTWQMKIFSTYGSNYIEQVPLDTNILRWNLKTQPLKVSIDFPAGDTLPAYYRTEITKAFYQWQSSTGFIKFNFINNPSDADIVVKFLALPKSNCTERGCKYVVAYTDPTIRRNILKKMTITLYDKDAYGNYFSDKELYNTILHEIGHSLGIMGHSYSTDDLMYMSSRETQDKIFTRFRSSFQYISAKDLNTIRLLYNLEPDITNTSLNEINSEGLIYPPIVLGSSEEIGSQKLKEAENYIKNAPDLPGGYIDLAVAYAQLGKLRKATENLGTALQLAKTEQDKYVIYYNYAVVYLNNNNPESALKYAQTAQQINNNDEILDLISNIQHAISTKKKPFKDNFLTE